MRPLFVVALLFAPGTVLATESPASAVSNADNAWMFVSTGLVLMMTAPGLILFYGGLVRSKNVLSTMMHSLVLMGAISTCRSGCQLEITCNLCWGDLLCSAWSGVTH